MAERSHGDLRARAGEEDVLGVLEEGAVRVGAPGDRVAEADLGRRALVYRVTEGEDLVEVDRLEALEGAISES